MWIGKELLLLRLLLHPFYRLGTASYEWAELPVSGLRNLSFHPSFGNWMCCPRFIRVNGCIVISLSKGFNFHVSQEPEFA